MPMPNDILASSKEDLEKVLKDVQKSKRSLPASQVFEIWCKVYDKSYPSRQDKLHRFTVFVTNLDTTIKHNKMEDDKDGTSRCYWRLHESSDLTEDELMKAYFPSPRDISTQYVHNFFLLIIVHFLKSFTHAHTRIYTRLLMLML